MYGASMQYPPWAQPTDTSAAAQPPAQYLAAPAAVPEHSPAPSAPPAETKAAAAAATPSGIAGQAGRSAASSAAAAPLSWAARLRTQKQQQDQPKARAAGRKSLAGADPGDSSPLSEPQRASSTELFLMEMEQAMKNSLQAEDATRCGSVPLHPGPSFLPRRQNTSMVPCISCVAVQTICQCPAAKEQCPQEKE